MKIQGIFTRSSTQEIRRNFKDLIEENLFDCAANTHTHTHVRIIKVIKEPKYPALTFIEVVREFVELSGLKAPESGLADFLVTILGVTLDLARRLIVLVRRRRGNAKLVDPLAERGHILLGRHLRFVSDTSGLIINRARLTSSPSASATVQQRTVTLSRVRHDERYTARRYRYDKNFSDKKTRGKNQRCRERRRFVTRYAVRTI